MTISDLFFSKKYLLETSFEGELITFCESLFPSIYKLKDDPYWGIDDDLRKKIDSKYLCYQERNKIFLYYSRAFLEGEYSGKPIFPYFKGVILKQEGKIKVKGKLKFNKLFNLLLPAVILIGILLVIF